MIAQLRRRFIAIAMASFLMVVLVVLGAINGVNIYQYNSYKNTIMDTLVEYGGQFPTFIKKQHGSWIGGYQINAETAFSTRYFVVKMDSSGNILDADGEHIAAITENEVKQYAKTSMESRKSTGKLGIYNYTITNATYSTVFGTIDGYMAIFVDLSPEYNNMISYLLISSVIGAVSMIVVFILLSIFSKKAIAPVVESMEKQKQFITDAGHEIKTPLAIISANTDVLELTSGANEWTESIRNQTNRLTDLVKRLISLSKMDEEKVQLVFGEFCVSDAVWESAAPFETLAESKGRHLEVNIQPDITMNGDISSIRQLVSILLDNAVKYSSEGGNIKLSLSKTNKHVKLEVYNTADNISKEDLDKLFDRFYRADSSRSRETGGYGIGLSIAKAIVEAHKGKIAASTEDGKSISFTALLP
jgi:signal transduction histidine kinase